MRNLGPIARYIVIGAVGFWLPDILLNAFDATSFWRSTALPLLGFLIAYKLAKDGRSRTNASIAVFMIVGVWLLGSTAMMIAASVSGGGFRSGITETIVVILLGLLPPYTFIISVYDGSVIGLLLTTFFAIGAHALLEPDHWIVPPSLGNRLRRWYARRVADQTTSRT